MRIVLTNDDGIESPGLVAAYDALRRLGEVLVVAPDRDRSGVGRSLSFGEKLTVEEKEMANGQVGYICNGTPVDCLRLVALGLMDFEPDVVVAGVNRGENLGDDLTYSGTVAAAMEAIALGVPGIAVSLCTCRPRAPQGNGQTFYEPVAHFASTLVEIASEELPPGRILNVNAPNVSRTRGVEITRLGRRYLRDELVEVRDSDGGVTYDIYNTPPGFHLEEGTDVAAVEAGKISVTPVHLELTDATTLEELKDWVRSDAAPASSVTPG